MDILITLLVISLLLGAAAVAFFAWTARQETYEHLEELSLMPLSEDRKIVK